MVNILHIIYASIYFYLVYMGYYITYKMSRINRSKAAPKNTLNTQPLTSSAMDTDAIEHPSMHQEAMEDENVLMLISRLKDKWPNIGEKNQNAIWKYMDTLILLMDKC